MGKTAGPKLRLKLAKPRVWELDYFRGCLLIFVTLDHCFVFLPHFLQPTNAAGAFIVELSKLYTSMPERRFIQPGIIFIFALLSGINCCFVKNHLRRATSFGLFVSCFMLLHKIGTLVFPSFLRGELMFNILAILAISTFVWWFLKAIKTPDIVIALLAVLCIGVGMWFCVYFLKTDDYYILPHHLRGFALLVYSMQGYLLSPNNFEPLLPSLGFFLAGGLIGNKLYKNKRSLFQHAPCACAKSVMVLGKHSLIAYLFAPVVIIGLCLLLNVWKVL